MNDLFQLSTSELLIIFCCGILIGMSKAGVKGLGMVTIPIFAYIFGGKVSTGILLPVLIMADILAAVYYHKKAEWKYVFALLPWAGAGIVIALFTGNKVNDQQFKMLISGVIIVGLLISFWREFRNSSKEIPDNWWFAAIMGLFGGFATMIGNAAGPILTLYLLSMRLPKYAFIGTGAWFFLIINVTKVPFHILGWETINHHTFIFDFMLVPFILTGFFMGVKIIKSLSEKIYRLFIYVVTLLSSVLLFI